MPGALASGHRSTASARIWSSRGLEGAPRDDLDSDAQEFLKILNQADVIKKGGAWLEIHGQV